MKKIAIFASGSGSNAAKIIERFTHSSSHPGKQTHTKASAEIVLIVCNKPGAGVLKIAENENIPSFLLDKERFFRGDAYIKELKEKNIHLVVLAGFLWKIPTALIQAYPGKIINIHPALLPKFGGKGMYGNFVHQAVIAAGEKESGITIHYVDEQYDHGSTIFQATCPVLKNDTPDTLAKRVQQLEHEFYPAIIEQLLES